MFPQFTVEKLKKPRFRIRIKSIIKSVFAFFVWFFVVGAIFFLSYFIYLQRTIPDPESIVTRKIGESTKIYDSTGEVLLYDIHGEEKRTVIPWEQIPDSIKQATLASEDSDFYNHSGIDFRGIVRASIKNIMGISISQGGSTITQQLVKKALLGDERTFSRKIKEVTLTIEIERRFSKDELFWMYLNQIPYGSNAYGIESASKTFFNKSAKDLTLAESAVLAALPKAPTYYSPYGNHADELLTKKDSILKRIYELGFISNKDLEKSLGEEIKFTPGIEKIAAPHFVIMIKEYLVSKYGESAVENNGLKVITTLDADLQKFAEESVLKYSKINQEKYGATNTALIALNPKTGEIITLVGSSDYFDIENEGNFNVATAKRQPGSAFKPFAYAAAFQKGYPDATILFDVETEFNPNCPSDTLGEKDEYGLDCYSPINYDGRFRGPVTMRNALSQSLNVPSVKVLYLADVEDTINLAEAMGITTLQDRSRFGLSLVLGGAEVKLVDLVSAYGVFANDGIKNSWLFIKKVENSKGEVLEEYKENPKRVLDEQVARLVTDILSDNNARAPVFGYTNSLFIQGREVAAKTGTTQENRDAWVVGYSPSVVVGVWTGNNDNRSMTQAGAGISASGPLWHEVILKALEKTPVENFNKPSPVFVDKLMLSGRYSPQEKSVENIHNILYYIDKTDPLASSFPVQPKLDPQFDNWEWAVRKYYNLPY